jgi:hypothetical protein
MNYYIIPKNNFNIDLSLKLTSKLIKPYISNSLIYHLNDIYKQLFNLQDNASICETDTIEYVNKIVNPFEFIQTNVPGSIISVSKVKPDSNIFFELMEIFQLFNINEILSTKHKINIAHLTHNYTSTNYLLDMLREENDDFIISEIFDYNKLYNMFVTKKFETKLDLIICEFKPYDYNDTIQYTKNMILIFTIITKYQSNFGTCIIKLDNIFYKAIIDVIFLLSSFYDKIILIKPIISNIIKGERYIVCKSFNSSILEQSNICNNINEQILTNFNENGLIHDRYIYSIVNDELPYYFLNKLEESNAVIGQQQLEAYDQIINIFKHKNRDEKIENLKRHHIQKCIQWCEKNQLPHNKFIDKVNIFLTQKKIKCNVDCL